MENTHIKQLPVSAQEDLDFAMAYFHPEEKIFSDERQLEKMHEAVAVFESELGTDHVDTVMLRSSLSLDNKEMFYNIVDQYVNLD